MDRSDQNEGSRTALVLGILFAVFVIGVGVLAYWLPERRDNAASAMRTGRASVNEASSPTSGQQVNQDFPSPDESDQWPDEIIVEMTDDLTAEARLQEQVLATEMRIPVSKWQKERVDNISNETLEETIQNLANFDDNQFAMTVAGDGFVQGDPEDEMRRIVHLSRVRRLLEVGRKAHQSVVPMVKSALHESLESWPQALAERQQRWRDNPNGWAMEGPDNYDKAKIRAMAATYLLAELKDFESLPLLVDSYRLQDEWIRKHKPYPCLQVPVPPTISLYAMHRLVSAYPPDRMTTQARGVHEAYMDWANENLAPAIQFGGTTWDATHDASDPMVRIADPKGVLLRGQRNMELVAYPHEFADGERVEGTTEPNVKERGRIWFDHIERFVEAAFQRQASAH